MCSYSYEKETKKIRDRTLPEILEKGEEFCIKMEKLWIIMFGKDTNMVNQRYESIHNHIIELFGEMLDEENENVHEIRASLQELVLEAEALKTELAMNVILPFQVDINGINLKKQKEDLEDFLISYKKIKEDRITLLESYKVQEDDLCNKLGIKIRYNKCNDVPSEAQLEKFKIYLNELVNEKLIRTGKYLDSVAEIKHLVNKLEISQFSNFEKTVLNEEKEFQLNDLNMELLEDWKIRLYNQHEEEIKLVLELQEKISLLWDRLDIDRNERERFLVDAGKKCGKSIVEQYKNELKRCEELKKNNIETVILRLRNNILDLWDRCHISEGDRKLYLDFYRTNFNEELLESHEREIERLNAFYEETRNIYELAEKWFELWNKMILLENQSNNVERLNNRGGKLLKEERERKKIQKELPKVETKLEKLIQKFEQNHMKPFLYDGIPLMTMISTYWANRKVEKENEKEVRKTQNATKITPLKSVNRIMTTSSALSDRKRVRPVTPVEVTKKNPVRRALQMNTAKSETTVRTVRRRSRSHDPTERNAGNMNLRSNSANSSVASYTGFQNYIEMKSRINTQGMSLRSSLSPLIPSNIVTPMKKRTRLQTSYSASKLPRPKPRPIIY